MFFRKPQEFTAPFAGIPDEQALEELFQLPGPTLLYLHDPWCPVSARAYRVLAALDGPIPSIDVSTQHDLTQAIEDRTGIRHESPQAILLVDGAPVWHASHGRISSDAIAEARQALDSGPEENAQPGDAL
jgi:bacillithiol system protein YtxJ